jgi:hypothetical protein
MDPRKWIGSLCAASMLLCWMPAAADHKKGYGLLGDSHDLRRLMQPSPVELASEQRGHIHIYDALEINQVNAALDENFDRIQNMMFTRIHHLPPTGSGPAEVEDDGCE